MKFSSVSQSQLHVVPNPAGCVRKEVNVDTKGSKWCSAATCQNVNDKSRHVFFASEACMVSSCWNTSVACVGGSCNF